MKIHHIYNDAAGKSHFGYFDEQAFSLPLVDKKSWRLDKNAWLSSQNFTIISLEPGAEKDWLPAPTLAYLIVLKGIFEVEVGSGEIRQFTVGDISFVEDTVGRGHKTRLVGNESGRLLIIAAAKNVHS